MVLASSLLITILLLPKKDVKFGIGIFSPVNNALIGGISILLNSVLRSRHFVLLMTSMEEVVLLAIKDMLFKMEFVYNK